MSTGHYVCWIREGDLWYEYDDEKVTFLTKEIRQQKLTPPAPELQPDGRLTRTQWFQPYNIFLERTRTLDPPALAREFVTPPKIPGKRQIDTEG